MLKAVIFDIDDTLLDWSGFTGMWTDAERPHIEKVVQHITALHPLAENANYIDAYVSRVQAAWGSARSSLIAPHLGRILIDTAIALGVPDHILDLQKVMEAYAWDLVEGITLFPDVIDTLTRLRDNGIELGLVTNSFHPASLRDKELEALGLLEFFPNCRVTAADAGVLKPHADIFYKALEKLNATPDEAVFVGDNPVADIAGAQGAGMRAVLRVKSPPQPLISGLIVPDAAINSLHDLDAWLDEWFAGWRKA